MIITAEYTVSRGTDALLAPPASMIESTSAVSMTVTAIASTSVPKGSPTLCAMTSAWCTAAMTAASRAGTQASSISPVEGKARPARNTPRAASGRAMKIIGRLCGVGPALPLFSLSRQGARGPRA